MAENPKVIDCRWLLADISRDIAISGSEEAMLNSAMKYAVESHGFRDTPAFREQLRCLLRDEGKAERR
jgi:hypothetical protein